MPPFLDALRRGLLDRDDPDHARLRRLVQAGFTPRGVAGLAGPIAARCEALLDRLEGRDGPLDLIAAFALPLPVAVIGDLIGVPEEDQPRFARWSSTLIHNGLRPLGMLRALPAVIAMLRYLRSLIRRKRDEPAGDLATALVRLEQEGDRLDEDELLAVLVLLLTAGHETTTNLIAKGLLALLEAPEQKARLMADPGLAEGAVERIPRLLGPVEFTTQRYAREAIEVPGGRILPGELVWGAIACADRDPEAFAAPEMLDIARTPNRHLTFGGGVHVCLGAPLARLEGTIALPALLRRFPAIRLARPDMPPAWRPSAVLRGMEALPVLLR